jgi:hypothetical protein
MYDVALGNDTREGTVGVNTPANKERRPSSSIGGESAINKTKHKIEEQKLAQRDI